MKDIALRAGVSRTTVSFVLNDDALPPNVRISEDTRRHVLTVAREMGYLLNTSARAVSTGRFHSIALLLSIGEAQSDLSPLLVRGIHEALREHDLHLTVESLPDRDLQSDEFVPKVLRQWMTDGLLINYTHQIPERMIGLIREHAVPSIWINSRQGQDCVHPDDFGAGKAATEYLLSLGHRSILYVYWNRPAAHYSQEDRRAGYEAAMHAAGLVPRLLPLSAEKPLREQEETYLAQQGTPTAIVGYEWGPVESLALLLMQHGRRVPDDLSLITFDPYEMWAYSLHRQVTLWKVPQAIVGKTAVHQLLQKLKEPERALPCQAVPFSFQPGETCAPPPVASLSR